ncbi:MAG: FMN-binding protein [bacterium]|nr:FMN-binding protein [bacterium]
MRDKKYAGIIAGLFVVAITAFTIWGTDFLGSRNAAEAVAMDVKGTEGIKEASSMQDKDGNVTGYKVVTVSKGFAGEDVEITVSFEADGTKIAGFELGANNETPTLGGQIGEAAFVGSVTGVTAPVKIGTVGEGTEVEAVSGATLTSQAAATSINNAYNFIQSNK